MGRGIVREFGMDIDTLLYLKRITDKDLLYMESAQCYVAAWMGGEFGGEWILVYIWLSSLHSSPETITILNQLQPNTK